VKILMTPEFGPLRITPRSAFWFKRLVNYVRMHPHAASKRNWFLMGDGIQCKGLNRLNRIQYPSRFPDLSRRGEGMYESINATPSEDASPAGGNV